MIDTRWSVLTGTESQKQISGEYSRPLDVHRWTDHPELTKCLDRLQLEIEATESRERKRPEAVNKKFRAALRCLVLDLYVAWATDPQLLVGVSLGKTNFKHETRYDVLFLSYLPFISAFEGLERLGYLEVVYRGFNDRATGIARSTRVRATEKLISVALANGRLSLATISYLKGPDAPESIILKDSNKQPVDYCDTEATRPMRDDLETINNGLEAHWIDLGLSDSAETELRQKLKYEDKNDDQRPAFDLVAKRLYRVFNNSSWSDGGRFYGGWWQSIPSEYRKHITIDGKRTVETDYSGMHVQMLYAEAGIDPPITSDIYVIPGLNAGRDLIKRTFNKLINATGKMRIDPEFDTQAIGLNWREFLVRVQNHFSPIKQFLGSGHGLKLQKRDADIANAIMLEFFQRGYVCLPVHDSFLVHHALADELEELMLDQFKLTTGLAISLKTKWGAEQAQGNGLIDHEEALLEAFGLSGDYQGFNSRQYEWELFRSGGTG